jgi:hypothetical protein
MAIEDDTDHQDEIGEEQVDNANDMAGPAMDVAGGETSMEEEKEIDPTRKVCSSKTVHTRNNWGGWEEKEHTWYVKEGGTFFNTKCQNCKLSLLPRKMGKKTTPLNTAHPARVCALCKNYIICHSCYVSSLMEDEEADPNDPRRGMRITRKRSKK